MSLLESLLVTQTLASSSVLLDLSNAIEQGNRGLNAAHGDSLATEFMLSAALARTKKLLVDQTIMVHACFPVVLARSEFFDRSPLTLLCEHFIDLHGDQFASPMTEEISAVYQYGRDAEAEVLHLTKR